MTMALPALVRERLEMTETEERFTVIHVKQITEDVIVHVTIKGYEWWKFRLGIAAVLIRVACWVADMGLEFKKEDSDG